eukprot:3996280-Heterocapsa_arctica.AAC.1
MSGASSTAGSDQPGQPEDAVNVQIYFGKVYEWWKAYVVGVCSANFESLVDSKNYEVMKPKSYEMWTTRNSTCTDSRILCVSQWSVSIRSRGEDERAEGGA